MAVARSDMSGVPRGRCPLARAWGCPPVLLFLLARRAKVDFATALVLRRFEAQKHAPELDLIVVMQRSGCLAGKPLAIEEREICTILVLNHILAILDKDASMHA